MRGLMNRDAPLRVETPSDSRIRGRMFRDDPTSGVFAGYAVAIERAEPDKD